MGIFLTVAFYQLTPALYLVVKGQGQMRCSLVLTADNRDSL